MQGRTNRQTPEWASTHPLSENRMQRALPRRGRPAGSAGDSQPRRFPRPARRHVRRRRSRAGRDRRAHLHPPRPAHPVPRAAGLSDVQRHRRRDRSRAPPARRSSAAAGSPAARRSYVYCVASAISTRGQMQLTFRRRSARTINGMPAAYHDGAREQLVGTGRRQRRRLSMGRPSAFIISSC